MRCAILLLATVFSLASVISLSSKINVVQAEMTHEFFAKLLSATPQPLQTLEPRFSTEEMLELAEAAAHDYGLQVIDGEPEWIWTTGDSELSGLWGDVLLDPSTPLFRVSFRGNGFWAGAGCGGCGPIPINGITFTIDGLTSNVLLTGGGYRSLLSTPTPEITIEPEFTAEPQPTATHVPVTPPPDAMSEAELVAIAKDEAIFNGLETFDGPPRVAWMTRSEWENSKGMESYGISDHAIIFVVAFRGTGTYRGFGGGFSEEPLEMNGFTVTLHPRDGYPFTLISGFYAPPFATEYADWAEIE
jgi:hypothetical protein